MSAIDIEPVAQSAAAERRPEEESSFRSVLALWVGLILLIGGATWAAGFRTAGLTEAVETGAARVESLGVGEVGDDLIRKAIKTQHETKPFWTVLSLIGDFLLEPLSVAARAVAVATAFSALAAHSGRQVGYEASLLSCSRAQGFWVAGLAVQAALMFAFRRADVETSAAVFLPAGKFPAPFVLALRQLDPFILAGWVTMAIGGVRRRQVGLAGAILVIFLLAAAEASARVGVGAAMGAGMRLSVMPK